ncbi:hypothetical protein FHX82_005475 [Amycolatopsis bartoniae]|uniref:DUF3500 domain-containing protein n=1 Tax=Amycolatopsis bartoniae TaxID=941986 RepID=A0A8H9IYL3_9PSEU|nr:DUF3500 domain-containing protein [Amycolatopsis bartoniae]MBB2938397.1 hypothetical protein [Amycolatopsis bartoniae]TVT06109.1 DUF3500 domain-containing protein [Amycolatopsis bartoniae]GHF71317.1 hypothetical protein GCM10017566_51480 [Amycolatopsis bartoniae]
MGLRKRGSPPTKRPALWTPELLRKIEWRVQSAAVPFRGLVTEDGPRPGLFPLTRTGVDVTGLRRAAEDYLAALTPEELTDGRFAMHDVSWRHWGNGARYFLRHGLCLEDLDERKRELALEILRRSLSDAGYQQVLDLMRLNLTIGELRGETGELNEWVYWFSIYGEPEKGRPWGWQLDGHHVNVNCVLVGDQLVLTPSFLGAEPVVAEGGKFAGTQAFRREEALGQQLFASFDAGQRERATIADVLPEDLFVGAFRDNFELNYEGLPFADLTEEQHATAMRLVELYTGRANKGHAEVRREEVLAHADETHFAWVGDPDGVFYYRVHSPVILIEFEHQAGVMYDNDTPTRRHIHTIVRTPNGGDYGADLLRQHHERHHGQRRSS